ncbi:MAG: acyltransferase family protein [Bacteroidaceae bacterium]
MKDEELQSKVITFLRFPLIVGVVLIHASFRSLVLNGMNMLNPEDFPYYTGTINLFADVLARTTVPLLFFFSGFLFFYKSDFTFSSYGNKIKKRGKTLLIPYLFWNLEVIFILFLTSLIFPHLMSGAHLLIQNYTFVDWINSFYAIDLGRPICMQLWFLRDLMVVMIFSPIIFLLLKYLRQYILFIFGTLWFFNCWFSLPGFDIGVIFFFSVGAYFSIHKRNFVTDMKPLFPWVIFIYPVFVIGDLLSTQYEWGKYIYSAQILVGMVFAITLSAYFISRGRWKVNAFLAGASFFVYAYHNMALLFIWKSLFKLLYPVTDAMLVFMYFFCSCLTILLGLALYYVLKKYLPRFTQLITGGR